MWWISRALIVALMLGAVALGYVLPSPPPAITRTDPDTLTLARERSIRIRAHKTGELLPGGQDVVGPLEARLARGGFRRGQPIFLRIYKLSFEAEVWIKRGPTYALFATYPICTFSGRLGPKLQSMDYQSPEGIYTVTARQMNPHSRWHRSFNLGFPNSFDRAHGRTGSYLMVHGGCSSIGCYAMTNQGAEDLFNLAKAAFSAGQPSFQVQALPFRMTADELDRRKADPNAAFWADLKTASDAFDAVRLPPDVAVCQGRYATLRSPARPAQAAACHKI